MDAPANKKARVPSPVSGLISQGPRRPPNGRVRATPAAEGTFEQGHGAIIKLLLKIGVTGVIRVTLRLKSLILKAY